MHTIPHVHVHGPCMYVDVGWMATYAFIGFTKGNAWKKLHMSYHPKTKPMKLFDTIYFVMLGVAKDGDAQHPTSCLSTPSYCRALKMNM